MGTVYKVLKGDQISDSPDYFSGRLILELCENIHLHYRNLRVEFSPKEFVRMSIFFSEAFKVYQRHMLDMPVASIPIAEIDPFDAGHQQKEDGFYCADEQQSHLDGIAKVKELIQEGRAILPIAVCKQGDKYVRLDGFKRYWAFKELGYEHIECYVLNEFIPGIQDSMAWTV